MTIRHLIGLTVAVLMVATVAAIGGYRTGRGTGRAPAVQPVGGPIVCAAQEDSRLTDCSSGRPLDYRPTVGWFLPDGRD